MILRLSELVNAEQGNKCSFVFQVYLNSVPWQIQCDLKKICSNSTG